MGMKNASAEKTRAFNKKIKSALLSFLALVLLSGWALAAGELPEELIPGGFAVGIVLEAEGVIAAGYTDVEGEDGGFSPAERAGILPGDLITHADGRRILCGEDLFDALQSGGRSVELRYIRGGKEGCAVLEPRTGISGNREAGLIFRDNIAGIGTVTYVDPESGDFGALGHAVNESGSGQPLESGRGTVSPADISEAVPGKAGEPGMLQGEFSGEEAVGTIEANTESGIFGELEQDFIAGLGDTVRTAAESEISLGGAEILADISGSEAESYDAEIIRLYRGREDGRSFMIKVTDEELLKSTGGIVQGMSGSPVLQNGRLVGAVTHVLLNDPSRGYGISIEKMLEAA